MFLIGGLTIALMGIGRAIYAAPIFFLILSILYAFWMWHTGESAYVAFGTIIGMGAIIATVVGIGVGITSGPFIGLIVFSVIIIPVAYLDGLRNDYMVRPYKTKSEVMWERYVKSAPILAEIEADRVRNGGEPNPPLSDEEFTRTHWGHHQSELPTRTTPTVAPPAPVTPAPQPYALKSWDNDPTPAVRPAPVVTPPVVTPKPVVTSVIPVISPVISTAFAHLLWRFAIIVPIAGVIFVGAWLYTLARTTRRKSQAATFTWAYSDENPANWR